jgi:two-component system sensor histidine kinase DegS
MVLDDLGLVPAVKRLIDEAQEQSGMEIQFNLIGTECRLDSAIEIALYRVVQEAINNTRKHASASLVQVKLEFLTDRISAVIEDNGAGFEVERLNERLAGGDHFGLYGMRERVELLGGVFRIRSKKGEGTRVSVVIPLKQKG